MAKTLQPGSELLTRYKNAATWIFPIPKHKYLILKDRNLYEIMSGNLIDLSDNRIKQN